VSHHTNLSFAAAFSALYANYGCELKWRWYAAIFLNALKWGAWLTAKPQETLRK
jgi:hypothetical protein